MNATAERPYFEAEYADGRKLAEWLLPRLATTIRGEASASLLRQAQAMRQDGRRVGFSTADRLVTALGRHPLDVPDEVWIPAPRCRWCSGREGQHSTACAGALRAAA